MDLQQQQGILAVPGWLTNCVVNLTALIFFLILWKVCCASSHVETDRISLEANRTRSSAVEMDKVLGPTTVYPTAVGVMERTNTRGFNKAQG